MPAPASPKPTRSKAVIFCMLVSNSLVSYWPGPVRTKNKWNMGEINPNENVNVQIGKEKIIYQNWHADKDTVTTLHLPSFELLSKVNVAKGSLATASTMFIMRSIGAITNL